MNCKMSALGEYQEAFDCFEKLNHLKGMALCKKMASQVCIVNDDDSESDQGVKELEKEAQEYEQAY